tara:strand:- start:2258 stop:2698 length:441 start_codon:yes stop_codon:yes gene_type:complete
MKKSHFKNNITAWEFITYPRIKETTGVLGVVELGKELDFVIKRIFYLTDVPEHCGRGFHSHKELMQLVLCLKGSFSITLDNGTSRENFIMTPETPSLYLDGRVWREMGGFSDDAVMLVLCDKEYRFDEVVRDYNKFSEYLVDFELI